MLHIRLLCIGTLKEQYWKDAMAEYQKRLGAYCRFSVEELPEQRLPHHPAAAQIDAALYREGQALLSKIPATARVYALCVEGRAYTSEQFSDEIGQAMQQTGCLCLIIGSSYGLHPLVKQRADIKLSISAMTLPHQLARVVLAEQIYRGFRILRGETYHK